MKGILLFDLDGTLLTSRKIISEKTMKALLNAKNAGYLIGISTSRSTKNSQAFFKILEPDVIIASGGAIVIKSGNIIYKKGLSIEETNGILKKVWNVLGKDCEITIDTIYDHYANYGDKYSQLEKTWGDDIYTDFSDWNKEALKVCVRIMDGEKAKQLKKELSFCDCIRFSEEHWYKFTKANVTKENAIDEMCRALGIKPDDIIAFGDDLADIGMLKKCGTGVAMGNALDIVKKNADIVIGSNDADGIADYLNDII